MAIVVELLNPAGQRSAMKRLHKDELMVGRDFGCDFVLADQYVDPRHCRIVRDPDSGRFRVEDLATVNGTRVSRKLLQGGTAECAEGTILSLGKTQLRILDPARPVPAAEKLTRFDKFIAWANRLSVCLLLLFAVSVYSLGTAYLYSDATVKPSGLIGGLLVTLGMLTFTTAFWGLIGRISTRRANIKAHASIASLFWLLGELLQLGLGVSLFNTNGSGLAPALNPIAVGVLSVLGQFLHLSLATRLGRGLRLLVVGLILALSPGLTLYQMVEDREEFSRLVGYPVRIYAPALFFGETKDAGAFPERSVQTFRAADDEVEWRAARDEQRLHQPD